MYGNKMTPDNGYDDEDLGAMDVAAAIFGPESTTPNNRDFDQPRVAQQPFAAEMNGVYKDFPFQNPPGPLNEQQQAIVNAVALQLARLMRNTNVTTADPAHVSPTLWSDPIDITTRVTLPAAADPPNVWRDGITFKTPPGRSARFSAYGFDVDDPAYTYNGDIQWRIVVQNRAVPNLNLITEHRGSLLRPRETFFVAAQDYVTKLQFRRAVAGAADVDIDLSLQGWTWRLRNDYEGTRSSTTAY